MHKSELVIIGAGPAGLSAAIEAAKIGASVLLLDENERPGGQLFKQIHKFFGSHLHKAGVRGMDIGTDLLEETASLGINVWLKSEVCGIEAGNNLWVVKDGERIKHIQFKKLILATGATENAIAFPGWELPGVMGAGAAQTMINVNRVLPGKRVVMIGSGNVGVIVSYQLMQAGAHIAAIVEAAPMLGGYGVHTAKVRRAGVPFYTSHTIKRALGSKSVEKVELVRVDEKFQHISGTEFTLDADTVCLAAGLSPLSELAWIAGCNFTYIPSLGGHIPMHDEYMRTTQEDIYVAGDISGVEEASTAMEEGKLAGICAAMDLGYCTKTEGASKSKDIRGNLDMLRCGFFGQKRRDAKNEIIKKYVEMVK